MDFIEILNDKNIAVWGMAIIVFLLTYVLKLPIKLATKHIKNEQVRKATNSVILLIPFGLGIVIQYLYDFYITKQFFDVVSGLIIGGQAVAVYGIVERFFKVKVNNPYESEEGEFIVNGVNEIIKDGKIDSQEVQDFFDKLNNEQK